MSRSRSLRERAANTGKRKIYLKKMNEGSVAKQKINHALIAKVGGQLELCSFFA
jgi:hypothetical protein